jgi:molybdopterin molybdotransferase
VLDPLADDGPALRAAFAEALASADVLVTIGGVSVGDHDLVRPTLESLGVALDWIKVAVRPGKPLSVGHREQALVLGLPGNPASALVTFALFGLPAIRRMYGDTRSIEPISATLACDVSHPLGRRSFLRATLVSGSVEPHRQQASGSTLSLAHANALLSLSPDVASWARGDSVDVYRYSDLGLLA